VGALIRQVGKYHETAEMEADASSDGGARWSVMAVVPDPGFFPDKVTSPSCSSKGRCVFIVNSYFPWSPGDPTYDENAYSSRILTNAT